MDPSAAVRPWDSSPHSVESRLSQSNLRESFLAAVGILRLRRWDRGVILALTVNLIAGAVLTYICFYQPEIPGFYGDTPVEALAAFAAFFVLACTLFLSPWVFWSLWDRFKKGSGGFL